MWRTHDTTPIREPTAQKDLQDAAMYMYINI